MTYPRVPPGYPRVAEMLEIIGREPNGVRTLALVVEMGAALTSVRAMLVVARRAGKIRVLRGVWLPSEAWAAERARLRAESEVRRRAKQIAAYALRGGRSDPSDEGMTPSRCAGDQPLPPTWMRSIFDLGTANESAQLGKQVGRRASRNRGFTPRDGDG